MPIVESNLVRPVAVDAHVASAMVDEEGAFMERLVIWASERFGAGELVRAKEEYFVRMGKVFPEDESYHARMSYFLDHYLLERETSAGAEVSGASVPWRVYCQESAKCRPGWELSSFCHSLFEVKKAGRWLEVRDMLSSKKLNLQHKNSQYQEDFKKGDIFQGFLYGTGERFVVSNGIIFHPERARVVIKAQAKKFCAGARQGQSELLARLARQQIRYLRHSHVDPRAIYAQDPR